MKPTTEHLNVDAAEFFRSTKTGEVTLRLITPMRQYDVPLLAHHAAALGRALIATCGNPPGLRQCS